jgi:hypothetical protein
VRCCDARSSRAFHRFADLTIPFRDVAAALVVGREPCKVPEAIRGYQLVAWAEIKDIAGPIATVIASAAAAFVAYRLGQSQIAVARTQANIAERNWQTTNEKIVLELFERRLSIYEAIRDVIGSTVRTGDAPDADLYKYDQAIDRVRYFFGAEVQAYLETLRHDLIELNSANRMMKNMLDPQRAAWIEKRQKHFAAVTEFYKASPPLFEPYMSAHQKVDTTKVLSKRFDASSPRDRS